MATLQTNRLLRSLSGDDFAQFPRTCQCKMFTRDEIVSCQDEPGDNIFFIVEGRARAEVSAPMKSSCKVVVDIFEGKSPHRGVYTYQVNLQSGGRLPWTWRQHRSPFSSEGCAPLGYGSCYG